MRIIGENIQSKVSSS